MKKERKKHSSKYLNKYGYSIIDIQRILGWSYGTVYSYFNDKKKRKEMLALVEKQKNRKKKGD